MSVEQQLFSHLSLNLPDISSDSLLTYSKDIKGGYLESNDAQAKAAGFKSPEDMRGVTDIEIATLTSHQTSLIRANDMRVMNDGEAKIFMDPITIIDKRKVIAISHKTPLRSVVSKKIVGITGVSFIIDEKQFFSMMLGQKEYSRFSALVARTKDILTVREIDCLYHYARGKTAKQVANILMISPRTVESHLSSCKQKLDCLNRPALIEKVLQMQECGQGLILD